MARRPSLAGQLLSLQLVLVLLVLGVVALVSISQSTAEFTREQGRRALAVSENVAANTTLRQELSFGSSPEVVRTLAESARTVSGVDEVLVLQEDRRVVASSDPALLNRSVALGAGSQVLAGRSWVGTGTYGGERAVTAYVPVLGDQRQYTGQLVGIVGTSTVRPPWTEVLANDTPQLLAYLGVASLLGVTGSLLLARRVKRQTLGLEPQAIAALVEHRDAMLQGVKEGVLGVDDTGRVTLVNDEAKDLLELPEDAVGRRLADLALPAALMDVLTGRRTGQDQVVVHQGRMLVLNRRAIGSQSRSLGSVATLRDRTELVTLQSELDTTKVATNTLRAQAHEFDNRLHVIAGLVELQEYDEVQRYVHGLRRDRAQFDATVASLVCDPAVAALLMAKVSVATERKVSLRISETTDLEHVDDQLTGDVVTVVGNLIDNAVDAAAFSDRREVVVAINQDHGAVQVTVGDSGDGVPAELLEEVFQEGFSTKAGDGQRGFGLALTRLVCTRRGGTVVASTTQGSHFLATLPYRSPA